MRLSCKRWVTWRRQTNSPSVQNTAVDRAIIVWRERRPRRRRRVCWTIRISRDDDHIGVFRIFGRRWSWRWRTRWRRRFVGVGIRVGVYVGAGVGVGVEVEIITAAVDIQIVAYTQIDILQINIEI